MTEHNKIPQFSDKIDGNQENYFVISRKASLISKKWE